MTNGLVANVDDAAVVGRLGGCGFSSSSDRSASTAVLFRTVRIA